MARRGGIRAKARNVSGQVAVGDGNQQNQVNIGSEDGPDPGLPWIVIGTIAGVVCAVAAVLALVLT